MGYGVIIGGGDAVNFSKVNAASYAALPSGKPVNTIGIISSVAVAKIYPTNETVSGLAQGDVVIRLGSTSNTRFNVLKVGRLDLYPVACYQYQSGVLTYVESYLYDGSSWKSIQAVFYDSGTISPSVGDFLLYFFAGSSATLTKGATEMTYAQTGTTTKSWAYSQNKINMTPFKTLHFYGKDINSGSASKFGAAPNNGSGTGVLQVTTVSTAYVDLTVDVDSANAEYHIYFGTWDAFSARTTYVNKIWAS